MLWNALVLALRAIKRNLMRSILTVLGIVIGVAAVITMVTIGRGATQKVTDDIARLGSNLLIVRPGQRRGGGASTGAKPFTIRDVEAIRSEVPGLDAVAPAAGAATIAVSGGINWGTSVVGTTNEYLRAREWSLSRGREFTPSELRAGKAVCIIGATVRTKLFAALDPVGEPIRLKRTACQVIGVLESKGETGFGSDQDDVVLVPLRMLQRRIAGNQDINLVYVSIVKGTSSVQASRRIVRLLRERRRITPIEDDDFSVIDMKQIASTVAAATKSTTALLGAVAAVSLLVGGIGIMNIMLVSVTERTREIGIRLAIGAMEGEVLMQFLVEAVVLASVGGFLGIAMGLGASWLLAGLMRVPLVIDPGIVAIAFLFSAAVGVIFGFLPARRGARLDPIEALRHE
jgi:putative ABC transport system permease protein